MLPLFTKLSVRKSQHVRGIVSTAREAFLTTPKLEGPLASPTKVDKTTLEGGVQVFSVDTPSPLTTVSVYVKAGSRYETPQTIHSSAFLKQLGFKGTFEKSAIRLIRDLEHIGATIHTDVSRDHISYHIRGLRFPESTDINLSIITETLRYALNPLLQEYEVDSVRPIVSREADAARADPKRRLIELVHSEAFRDSGLALPLSPTPESIRYVTNQTIHHHLKHFYYPGNRIQVVATGVAHDALLNKVKPLFTNPTLQGKFRELRSLSPLPQEPATSQKSTFVGSGITVRLSAPGNTHIALGYPGYAATSKEHTALSVLAEIIGGSTISNTGPGDARHTSRLYSHILEQHSFVQEASVFNYAYSDAGVFGVYVSASGGNGAVVVGAVLDVLKKTAAALSEEDVVVGKRAVENKFLRSISSDKFLLAEHLVSTGRSSSEYVEAVRGVNLSDVQSVAKVVFAGTPLLAAVGDVRGVPRV